MCLILMAYQQHPRYPLIIAANRDEFYDRPTERAAFWEESPELFAGRDLLRGGSWLGGTRAGRIAALTNYREPHQPDPRAPSRGELVSNFLKGALTPEQYLARLQVEGPAYHGFNLIFGTPGCLYCYSNRSSHPVRIGPGIHGLSNHLLDTPWPKVVRGKEALAAALREDVLSREALFALLADRHPAPDPLLPDTGIGLEWERLLSPIFIASERYGTRSSSLLLVGSDGVVTLAERTYNCSAPRDVEVSFKIGDEKTGSSAGE
jgi:uncharacterized protein with NRDE domain